ncbi:MAG: tail fiber domain-containing protein [Candidatus Omnitrophica bacterium]|nr:tail fiber domain-containing protein [Candidatus Omnitrophota bacterium]
MFKYILSLAVCLFFFPVFLFAEEITVTTYYPSPYGVYSELRTKKMAIGDSYIDSGSYTWETTDGDGGEVDLNADLVVEGNVGIGTANPGVRLELKGGHSDTLLKLYSTGDGGSSDAILSLWASEPGLTYTGVGIGNNINKSVYYGRTNTARGASYIRLMDNAIYINTISSAGADTNNLFISAGSVGIGTTSLGYTLSVAGTIWANGAAITAGATTWSDIRLKKDITVVKNALDRALKLKGVYYNWKDNEFTRNFPEGRQIGIIAQEMEKEFPELVLTDKNGYKTIAYDKFTAVLLEAVKEQEDKIESLQDSINSLKSRLDKLENPDKPNKL